MSKLIEESLELDCVPLAASVARRWAVAVLDERCRHLQLTSELVNDIRFCVSELVTNAVEADCSSAMAAITADRDRVRLNVTDNGAGLPRLVNAGPLDTKGRGLFLVDSVADRWGFTPEPDGKVVWAEFDLAARDARRPWTRQLTR